MSNEIQEQQEVLLLCPRRKPHDVSGEQAGSSVVMTGQLSRRQEGRADARTAGTQGEGHAKLVAALEEDVEKVGVPPDASLSPWHMVGLLWSRKPRVNV